MIDLFAPLPEPCPATTAAAYLKALASGDLAYHIDDDPATIHTIKPGEGALGARTFTDAQADTLRQNMERIRASGLTWGQAWAIFYAHVEAHQNGTPEPDMYEIDLLERAPIIADFYEDGADAGRVEAVYFIPSDEYGAFLVFKHRDGNYWSICETSEYHGPDRAAVLAFAKEKANRT